ncbi:MAG: c-type cytochrome [Gammaproteobacteria bacterium]|nr:c-type cytochrome [Gammaproteobacteria bacterium]
MNKRLLIGLLTACTVTWASEHALGHDIKPASPWTSSSWSKTLADMPKGDSLKGEKLHRYGLCITCHGAKGIAPSRNAPSLAGNTVIYTYKTLMDYQQGRRAEGSGKSEVMRAATQPMSKQDMADLAAYYAQQTLPEKQLTTNIPQKIDRLVRKGDSSRLLVPCASCHGAHGEGNGITPALAGQTPDYFIRTMYAYKQGLRTNDVNEGMSQFAHELTDAEIQALADYYATLSAQ